MAHFLATWNLSPPPAQEERRGRGPDLNPTLARTLQALVDEVELAVYSIRTHRIKPGSRDLGGPHQKTIRWVSFVVL